MCSSGIRTRYLTQVVLWLFALLAGSALAAEQFRMITLQHRLARDLVPVIEPLVGPEGSVRAIDQHLLVTASPERLAQIESVIERLDVMRRNVRITVSHSRDAQMQQRGAAVSGTIRAGDVGVSVPPEADGGVRLDVYGDDRLLYESGSGFLTVLDGERTYIRSGQIVPFTEQWLIWTRRYAVVQQTTVFQEVSTGFAVTPRYSGEFVELEITPRIAALNQAGYIDFEALSTTVSVRPGEWFDLGGAMQGRDEVSRAILASGTRNTQRKSTLRIKVD